MKKILLFVSLLTVFLSACGSSVSTNTSTPEFTQTPPFTSTPEQTATPEATATSKSSPTPEIEKPSAIVSSSKAKFIFPMPIKEEWEWFVSGGEEYLWSVTFKTDKFYSIEFSINNYKKAPSQKGNLDEMLKSKLGGISQDGNITSIYTYEVYAEDNNVVIELTGPIAASLYASKIPVIGFRMGILGKEYKSQVSPSYE